jgi:adenylate cyclase
VQEPRVERRLAAILASDVAGYSRLMGADEVGTLRALQAHRKELIDPLMAAYHGRIVKTTGDGIMAEFASAVDAIGFAVAVQRGMVRRNANVPDNRRVVFRTGINVGDIIVEDNDIYGDGVNIAARLEALAEPGGICISEDVYRQVRDKLPYEFADRGEQMVKNIVRPVRVYAFDAAAVLALPEIPASTERSTLDSTRAQGWRRVWPAATGLVAIIVVAGGIWLAVRPSKGPQPLVAPRLSLVVLPFANLSGDPRQDYLADVITEDLTTAVSRLPGSSVIARSTAFTYKGKPVDPKQIGRELGVRYVLEGSAQRSGDLVRVSAQLINSETGTHLWTDQFDKKQADLLQMQDEIVNRLARALQVQMVRAEASRAARVKAANPDAEDLAMRCEASARFSGMSATQRDAGYALCENALKIDARNVRALVWLADKFSARVQEGQSVDRQTDSRRADELVSRALSIDPNYYAAHCGKAAVVGGQKRFEEAIVEAEHCLELNPSYATAYSILALQNFFLGRPDEIIRYADAGMRLSPKDPEVFSFYTLKGWAYFQLRQYEQAIQWLRRAVAAAPEFPIAQAALASALALADHESEARDTLQHYLALPGTRTRTIAEFDQQMPSDTPEWLAFQKRFYDGLRKAGVPER